ncbi:MAG TPA: WecB/TagA/CpsF family glycosyltransferase [Pirellulales bacterium]|nr:WecB/TagA/CpsF family glycosyltransferase [Pirellulales bacterium]
MLAEPLTYPTPPLSKRDQRAWPPKVDLFGIHLSVTNYDEATDVVIEAARRREPALVACQAAHAVVTASCDPDLRAKLNDFDLVTPDGQPVRWAMNLLHGVNLRERVYGPELMLRLGRRAADEGVSIYLYGGSPRVIELLNEKLPRMCPGLRIAGAESPPFRTLTSEEDQAVVERINAGGAGLVFLGLGCPKQDLFAHAHRASIRAVQVCVGAAFDFHAGVKPMAPAWMQRSGLEWAFRLAHEPRRLGRRYLVTNSLFLFKLAVAWLKSGKKGRLARSGSAERGNKEPRTDTLNDPRKEPCK